MFDYVHSDLWGLTKMETHGGFYLLIIIINDFFRRVWVHILNNKSGTFENFKELHTLIGSQLGTKVNMLRIDNGLKFVLKEFNKFF